MEKRGLSAVITTVIMILVAIGAVAIVAVVVRNIVSDASEEISTEQMFVDLTLKNVVVNTTGTFGQIERKIGGGDLAGVKIILSDGTNTEVITPTSDMAIDELETKSFSIVPSEYSDLGSLVEVSIAPVVKSDSGEDVVGNIIDTFVL